MTELLVPRQMSLDEARRLTDEVKTDAAALWSKLLRLYEGRAHIALGYASWGAYWTAEFGGGTSHAYRLLDAARVVEMLHSPMGESLQLDERQARELVPLLDEPESMREVYREAVETYGPEPTAQEIRTVRLGVHFSSADETWETPADLFAQLDAEFRFELDVCASAANAKCERYFTEAIDGLAQHWQGVCWMNPPYGDVIGEWVAKAHEAGDAGATVVCLVPARTDTAWWWDHARHAEVRFLRGRLRFVGADSSAPFPSAVVIFGRPAGVVWWER